MVPKASTEDPYFCITVTRKSQLMDRNQPMQILVNGRQAGLLKNGQSSTFQIRGQQAELQAHLVMNKSITHRVNNSAPAGKAFLVQSSMTNTLFVIGTLLVIVSTALVIYTSQVIYMVIAAPPALLHLYLRFVKKDKYIVIREVGA